MASVDPLPQQALQTPASAPQRRQHRRGGQNQSVSRGGAHDQSTSAQEGLHAQIPTNMNALLALRPASVAPPRNQSSTEPSIAEVSVTEDGQSGRTRGGGSRGRGRGRGIGRVSGEALVGRGHIERAGRNNNGQVQDHSGNEDGGRHAQGPRVGSSRQFGGRLTEGVTPAHNQSVLSADAPEFHPGQAHQPRQHNTRGGKAGQPKNHQSQAKAPRARRQSLPKSTAPDIATRTHEDIASGIYECPICTNEVARNSKLYQEVVYQGRLYTGAAKE
ncbi:hypothetical protein N7G274_001619 [Stereocaulon virgatum]|uniref:Uncharacterized protein n=1 Tax=Stereocaulon virgatum TaxID=373712 RepID=A0ABR4AN85_9LECA